MKVKVDEATLEPDMAINEGEGGYERLKIIYTYTLVS